MDTPTLDVVPSEPSEAFQPNAGNWTGSELEPIDLPALRSEPELADAMGSDGVGRDPETRPDDELQEPLRTDLVTAEVAAVLSMIAHEYFKRPVLPLSATAEIVKFPPRLRVLTNCGNRYSGECKVISFMTPRR